MEKGNPSVFFDLHDAPGYVFPEGEITLGVGLILEGGPAILEFLNFKAEGQDVLKAVFEL